MPRTRSLAWAELKIGIVAVVSLVLATMIIVAVGGAAGFWWQRYELKTKFPDVKGLKSGAVVRVAGVEVGKVGERRALGGGSRSGPGGQEGERAADHERLARVDWVAQSARGTRDRHQPSYERDTAQRRRLHPCRSNPGQLADVADGARETLEQLTAVMKDIRAGKGTVGKLFSDDELYKEITAFVTAAQGVTSHLREGRGTFGRLLKDPAAYDRLNASLGDLKEITRQINAGQGSLGRFLKDDALAKSLTGASANIEDVTGRLRRNDNTMGKLLNEKELYDRFNSVANRVDALVSDIQKADGTLHLMLHNKELYENINATAKEARTLIEAIKKDPKKYLNIRVSIF